MVSLTYHTSYLVIILYNEFYAEYISKTYFQSKFFFTIGNKKRVKIRRFSHARVSLVAIERYGFYIVYQKSVKCLNQNTFPQ